MPRNGSGTYVLPAGNPVVTGTPISSAVQNTTMTDIATALTLSLPRDGQAAMTGALPMGGQDILNAGNITATANLNAAALIPTGSSVPVNGLYLPSAGVLGFAGASASLGSWSASALTAPSFVPTAVAVNGLGLSAANTPGLYSNSTLRWSVNSTGNHTFVAPSSGVPVTVNSTSATRADFNTTSGTGGYVTLSNSGTIAGYIGTGSGTIAGAALADLCLASATGVMRLGYNGGSATAIAIGAAGNVTIAAPSSGTALAIIGVAGGTSQSWSDGTRGAAIAHSASLVQIGTTTADSFGVFVNNSNKATFNTGLILGAPTGGDKGAGTLNTAGAIYQNNVRVPIDAFARVTAATGAVSNAQNIAFTSHTPGTGIYVFALTGFGSNPVVMVTMQNTSNGVGYVSSLSSSSVTITTVTTAGVPTDMDFSLFAVGT